MRKTLYLLIVIFTLAINNEARSQTYHAFKLDAGVGIGIISPSFITLTIEPHYRIVDQFAFGLRYQAALNGKLDLTTEGANSKTYFRSFTSNCVTGDYYILDGKETNGLQFFVGGGVGGYNEICDKEHIDNDNFGFFPRVGLEVKHFRAAMEYNFTGGTTGYLSLSASYVFGGTKK